MLTACSEHQMVRQEAVVTYASVRMHGLTATTENCEWSELWPCVQYSRTLAGRLFYLMVTLHPFLTDFLHWRTRRTHRSTTLCRACGHTAHAVRPRSRQFLVELRVECIIMEEQLLLLLLLLESPLLNNIIIRGPEKRLGEPSF